MKKPLPNNIDDINIIIELLNTHTISNKNSYKIKNIYTAYVGGSICLKCPSSLSNALKEIKKLFTFEQMNELKNKLQQ